VSLSIPLEIGKLGHCGLTAIPGQTPLRPGACALNAKQERNEAEPKPAVVVETVIFPQAPSLPSGGWGDFFASAALGDLREPSGIAPGGDPSRFFWFPDEIPLFALRLCYRQEAHVALKPAPCN